MTRLVTKFIRHFIELQETIYQNDVNKTQRITIGTDSEQALKSAIKDSFPALNQVLCTRHILQNVKDYLANKFGIDNKDRQQIINAIFGDNGLRTSEDSIVLCERKIIVSDIVEEKAPNSKIT